MNRIDWVTYFMSIAKVVSQRSHDIHTQHGCVITDQDNHILSTGYNGFPRGVDDNKFPTSRPDKYHWMIHAERNALANCLTRPENGIAYVTGQCCNDCIMALWQHGITKVVMMDSHGTQLFDEQAQKRFDFFVHQTKITVEKVSPDFSWAAKTFGV